MKKIILIVLVYLLISCKNYKIRYNPTPISIMAYTDTSFKFETPDDYIKRLIPSKGDTVILYDMEIFTFDTIRYMNFDTTVFENWKAEYIKK